jgi:REP element-mobilizing transposase RayT
MTNQGAIQGATKPRFGEVRIRNRGRLPHWERESGLADSLPRTVVAKIVERQRVLEAARRSGLNLLPFQKVLPADYSPRKIEHYLDSGTGSCHLRDPRIAELVAEALRFWDGQRYRLIVWCLMPNHVHVVFRLLPGQELSNLLRSWKSYTARTANRILGRTGDFWQREYYDRLIRDGNELDRAMQYVMQNPEKAGLSDWDWVWCAGVGTPTTAGLETGATR